MGFVSEGTRRCLAATAGLRSMAEFGGVSRRIAGRSIWWSALENGGLSVLSIATYIVLARLLDPADFGLFAIALAIVHVFGVFVGRFFFVAIVQRQELTTAHVDSAFWTSLGLGVVLAGVCWLGSTEIASIFDEPSLEPVLAWMGLGLIFGGLSGVLLAELTRNLEFKALVLRTLTGRLGGAVVAITLAVLGYGVWSLVAQHLVGDALMTCILWITARRRPAFFYSLARVRELVTVAVPVASGDLVWQIKTHLFSIFVGYFAGTTALGYLNVAFRLVDAGRDLLASSVGRVALPLFSRRQQDLKSLRRAISVAGRYTALITQPIFVGLAVTADEVVSVIFGAQWRPAVPLIQVLAVTAVVYFCRVHFWIALMALGRPQLNLSIACLRLVVTIGGLFILGVTEAIDAAYVWAFGFAAVLPYEAWLVRRVVGLGLRSQLSIPGLAVAAAVIMGGFVYAIKSQLPVGLEAIVVLAILIPCGAALYIAAVFAMNRRAIPECFDFIAMGLKRTEDL